MAVGSRESRRALAMDVRTMVWIDKKFDSGRFLRTGGVEVYRRPQLPDTPVMREALAEAYRQKERLFGGRNGK